VSPPAFQRLTFRNGSINSARFGPDGQTVLYAAAWDDKPREIFSTRAGNPESRSLGFVGSLLAVSSSGPGAAWFPDGKRIVCTGAEKERTSRSWVLGVDGAKPRPVTPEGVTGLLVSPDGKFLLAIDGEKKRALYPVDGGEPRPALGFEREDDAVRWSSDGHSVYVRRAIDMGARVFLLDLATGQRRLWKELTLAEPAGTRGMGGIQLTPDGKSYVYSYARDLTELYLVEGLK
jgi:Tol biopolymer transport system component